LTLWDAQTGAVLYRLPSHSGFGDAIAFTGDSRFVLTSAATVENDKPTPAITFLDVSTGAVAGQIPGPFPDKMLAYNSARDFAFDGDRALLAFVGEEDPHLPIILYEMQHSRLIGKLIIGHVPIKVALSPDGKSLAVGTITGHIVIFDVASLALVRDVDAYSRFKAGVASLAYSPDGRFLVSGPTAPL